MTKRSEQPAEHLGFARKYRPQGFSEVAGQAAVSITLKNAIADGRPAQAYLFFGPRGVGKTTTARILAKALNCQKGPTAEPCGQCPACLEIARGSSIDVLELDAATHTQVEKIREMIVETVSLTPSRDRYKIFIIDEVHMLSASSFNALLKTLEEPPAHVVFILATTDPGKIPATIVSRCQRFRFRPLPMDVLVEHLRRLAKLEKISVEPAALNLLARAAGGSLRDAVGLLEQAYAYADGKIQASQAQELLGFLPDDLLMETARAVLEKDPSALAEALERAAEEGYDPAHLLRDLRERLHESYLHRLNVHEEIEPSWKNFAKPHSAETFAFLVQQLTRALENIRTSDSPRLSLEISLFGLLESAYDLREWVSRLEALERRMGEAPQPPGGNYAPGVADAGPEISAQRRGQGRTTSSHGKEAQPLPAAPVRATVPDILARPQPIVPTDADQEAGARPAAAPERADASAGRPADGVPPISVSPALPGMLPALLEQVMADKPGLARDLESCRLIASEGPEWKLLFGRSFEMERAQNNQKLIESKLTRVAGRPICLKFEVDAGLSEGEKPHDAPGAADAGPEISAQRRGQGRTTSSHGKEARPLPAAPSGDMRSAPGAGSTAFPEAPHPAEDPAIKKVLEFFPGKVRHIKKK